MYLWVKPKKCLITDPLQVSCSFTVKLSHSHKGVHTVFQSHCYPFTLVNSHKVIKCKSDYLAVIQVVTYTFI
jgi:hypothetical protein